MKLVAQLNVLLERLLDIVVAVLFAGLIGTVLLQVIARNILQRSLIWTPDVAQLLFAWCIFLGAALAFRRGAHYEVDLWPRDGRLAAVPAVAAWLGSAVVVWVLLWNGAAMARIGLNRLAPSLGISELWFYLPIPLCGLFMALFMAESGLARSGSARADEAAPGASAPELQ